MAEERTEGREATWRQLLPWTELFRTFQVALDLNKLLLAAAGIFVTALGWWLLSLIFFDAFYEKTAPQWHTKQYDKPEMWNAFKDDRNDWNLMYKVAGPQTGTQVVEPADLAETEDELNKMDEPYKVFDKVATASNPYYKDRDVLRVSLQRAGLDEARARQYADKLGQKKPSGLFSTWPWFEDRGPNPFLLVTGQTAKPWEQGRFWEWFSTSQAPVLVEPLVKFLQPVVFFLSPKASGFAKFYFLCILLVTLVTWSVFGGAITRIAAVQVARGERPGLVEALRFTVKRLKDYITGPIFPLIFVLVLIVFMVLFGFLHMIPMFGDILVDGLFWWVMVLFGLAMAVALIGLIGWPLMVATISTEGTDSWEAVSRSYSYVFQRPWHYIWCSLVAIAYGAAVVFFVGFLGSFAVYLSKWGVGQTPFVGPKYSDRDPSFLFVYAPTSFHWRELMLEGTKTKVGNDERPLVKDDGTIDQDAYNAYMDRDSNKPANRMTWYNKTGAFLVAVWVYLIFLLLLGFGYSFFWSASTIIYLLMRRNVDAAELDEVYLEEDDQEGPFGSALTPPAAAPPPKPAGAPVTMLEPPTLRTPSSLTTSPPAAPPPMTEPTAVPPPAIHPPAAATPPAPTPPAVTAPPTTPTTEPPRTEPKSEPGGTSDKEPPAS